MKKIMDSHIHQLDIRILLEEITPAEAESLLGGYCQSSQSYPDISMGDMAEIMNQAKKQTEGVDNKGSKQKINTIDNSKKTYLNGVEIPRKGKTVFISL
jgi:hypothetical protein